MKNNTIVYFLSLVIFVVTSYFASAQHYYQGLQDNVLIMAVALFAYDNPSESNKTAEVCNFGTASIYQIPITTNDMPAITTIVTAKHNLFHKIGKTPCFHPTNLYDSILIKFNAKTNATKAKFIRIPIKKDPPHNFWQSERGLDLVVLPIPGSALKGTDQGGFLKNQILTMDNLVSSGVRPGVVACAVCMQPEYFNFPLDMILPQTVPTIRMGHLSRVGWERLPNGQIVRRPHVIDIHSSPGNSGASVVVFGKESETVTAPKFLGIVLGFPEEEASYEPYVAPVQSSLVDAHTVELVSSDSGATNNVVLTYKTVANPDLTSVTPVDELISLWDSPQFKTVLDVMNTIATQYNISEGPEIK